MILHGKQLVVAYLLAIALLSTGRGLAQDRDSEVIHFEFSANTGANYSVVVESVGEGCPLLVGDEIAIFDGDLCVGASVVDGFWPLALVAWADDEMTPEIDGYLVDQPIEFRAWRQATNDELPLLANFANGGFFGDGPYSVATLDCEFGGCSGDPEHFSFTANTGANYSIVVQNLSPHGTLLECDEIGVYDDTLCVGAAVFDGEWPLALVAWRDDPQTPEVVDGYLPGHPMHFRMWRRDLGIEVELEVEIIQGGGSFDSSIFSVVILNVPTTEVPPADRPPVAIGRITSVEPNPFNPLTTIWLDLSKSSFVTLTVHDLPGRVVRTLWSGQIDEGRHPVVWNGTDDRGARSPSGVYLVRLVTTDGVQRAVKVTLSK